MLLSLVNSFLQKILPLKTYNSLKNRAKPLIQKLQVLEYTAKWKLYSLHPSMNRGKLYPKFVSISPTTKCNLKCFICRHEGHKGMDLDLENLKKLKEVIKHAETIELTGWGEPLIYPKFEEALKYIYSINPEDNLILVITNGTRLSKKTAKILTGHIKQLTISLNAAKLETYSKYMKGGNFENIIFGIKEFLAELPPKERCKILFRFVAFTENFREIPDFIRLAHDLGISRVSIINYYVTLIEHIQYALLNVKQEYNSITREAVELGNKLGVEVMVRRFFTEKTKKFYNPDRNCQYPFDHIYIDTYGNVGPCCYSGMFNMGNVYENDFESVWFGEKYQKLRRKRNLPPCKTCMPFVCFDDYNAHFTPYLKETNEFKEIERDLKDEVS